MTNRMVLWDPQLGAYPPNQRAWAGFQRQLAEDTAPGFMSRVLLDDFTVTSNTTLQDVTVTQNATTSNMALSLKANVRYYYEFFGSTTRSGTDGVITALTGSGGLNAPTTGDDAVALYFGTGGSDTTSTTLNPFTTINMGSDGNGRVFHIRGLFSCTSAGLVTVQFAQRSVSDANTATLYAGTRIVFQPILNLSDRSNP